MKRIIALLLAALMLLTLASCGKEEEKESKKEKLYKKYSDIIDCLENEDYAGAKSYIDRLASDESNGGGEGEGEDEGPSESEQRWSADIIGEWIPDSYGVENGNGTFSFSETSCIIDGERCDWRLETEYITDNYATVYVSLDGVDEYQLSFSYSADSGVKRMSAMKKTENGEMISMNGSFYCLSQYTVIELTVDNYEEYFEWSERSSTGENAFGETESFSLRHYLTLKDEYMPVNVSLSNVAVEYSYVSICHEAEVDLSAMTYKMVGEEKNRTDTQTSTTTMGSIYHEGEADEYGLSIGGFSLNDLTESNVGTVWYTDERQILRLQGTVYVQNK